MLEDSHILDQICMPMWCTSSDTIRPNGIPEPHHRIVRIPPGESVVLNSAERAPYLLLMEILHDDLDFDPSKRSNKDILKKIVQKESEKKGASRDLIPFNREKVSGTSKPTSRVTTTTSVHPLARDVSAYDDDIADANDSDEEISPSRDAAESLVSPVNDEEIDLVEQLYGADDDFRLRSADLSETIVLPPAPKNKELDMVAWSRSSSMSQPISRAESGDSHNRAISQSGWGAQLPANGFHPQPGTEAQSQSSRVLSLDEYSERMRTAAVMLAQLNSNLTRDSSMAGTPGTPTIPSDSASALRWLPNTSWLTGPPISQPNNQPVAGPSSTTPMRMRLAYNEASAIRNRIMDEMLALEEERMERMRENREGEGMLRMGDLSGNMKTAEDEGIIRRELSRADPSAVVFSESWAAKKVGFVVSTISRSA